MQTHVMRLLTALFVSVALVAVAIAPAMAQGQGGQAAPPGGGRGPAVPPLIMTTTAFEDGGVVPPEYAGPRTQASAPAGSTTPPVSPELKFAQVPPNTQSFVLLFHDVEASAPPAANRSVMDVTHWLLWNIPGTATGLPKGVPQGAAELPDGSRQVALLAQGYMGPGAGPGPYHHYVFELWALDTKLDVPAAKIEQVGEARKAVMAAMEGHVLGKAVLVGRYHRQ